MADGSAPNAILSKRITLRRQLNIYEQFLSCESVEEVAAANKLSVGVTQAIVERVPRDLIPLTQLRRARACLDLEELAAAAIDRLRQIHSKDPWTLPQCIQVLNVAGTHFGKLIAADTPIVSQTNNSIDINADDLLEALNSARTRTVNANTGGNGNRLSGL